MKSLNLNPKKIQNLTDDQIKELARNTVLNGAYSPMICKGCGTVYCHQDAITKNAKIVTTCKKCFVPE